MKTSQRGIDLIKQFEGCELKAYRCPAGVLTVGIGHTSAAGQPKVRAGMVITEGEAERILKLDLGKYEAGVKKAVTVKLNQNQFDALVSFAFNVGIGNLNRSTLLKHLNKGRFDLVPAEFLKWKRAGGRVLLGLLRRRKAEAALFADA